MKPLLSSLKKTEETVALLLPGPQVLNDLNCIKEDFKTVVVNHHFSNLFNPDWMVISDQWGRVPEIDVITKTHPEERRISAHKNQCGYELDVIWWGGMGSAAIAFWFSCFIAEKVYVCGADLFQSKKWFFNEDIENPYVDRGLEWQLKAWEKAPSIARKLNTEIVIQSGPLQILFNQEKNA